MPRIPSTAFCRRPAGSWRWNCRATSASTSGVEAGGEVTPFYDAMIAKLIAHAPTREAALDRLAARARSHVDRRACAATWRFSPRCAAPSEFRQGKVDTGFIDRNLAALGAVPQPARQCRRRARRRASARAAIARGESRRRRLTTPPKRIRRGRRATAFSSAACARSSLPIMIDGESADATVSYGKDGMRVAVDGAGRAGKPTPGCSRPATRRLCAAPRPPDARAHQGFFRRDCGGGRRRRRHQGADARQGAGASRRGRRSRRRRPTPCRDRGDEDGAHAARAVCRRRASRFRSARARKLWKARRSW